MPNKGIIFCEVITRVFFFYVFFNRHFRETTAQYGAMEDGDGIARGSSTYQLLCQYCCWSSRFLKIETDNLEDFMSRCLFLRQSPNVSLALFVKLHVSARLSALLREARQASSFPVVEHLIHALRLRIQGKFCYDELQRKTKKKQHVVMFFMQYRKRLQRSAF